MLVKSLLVGCLAVQEVFTRAAAIELYNRGLEEAAGDHMAEVYRRAQTPDERRAAASFVVGAYRDAFLRAGDLAAAELLCRGLAIVEDFRATGGSETESARLRTSLWALRGPFGSCASVEEMLLPVSTTPDIRRRPLPAAPTPEPVQRLPADGDGPRRLMWAGIGVTAAGAVTAAVGLGLGLAQAAAAAQGADALTAGAPGRSFSDAERLQLKELRGEFDRGRAVAGVGAGVGAAMLVTGAVLTALGAQRRGRQRAALVPGHRGVLFTLRF